MKKLLALFLCCGLCSAAGCTGSSIQPGQSGNTSGGKTMEEVMPKAEATLKYARISSRKVKIVADLIRGKKIDEALAIVKYVPKASSEIIEKLLKSAIANAENNHHMAHEKLYVAEIYANQGPTLKRIRPAAKGSAVRIRKRTSHITIVLKELN